MLPYSSGSILFWIRHRLRMYTLSFRRIFTSADGFSMYLWEPWLVCVCACAHVYVHACVCVCIQSQFQLLWCTFVACITWHTILLCLCESYVLWIVWVLCVFPLEWPAGVWTRTCMRLKMMRSTEMSGESCTVWKKQVSLCAHKHTIVYLFYKFCGVYWCF